MGAHKITMPRDAEEFTDDDATAIAGDQRTQRTWWLCDFLVDLPTSQARQGDAALVLEDTSLWTRGASTWTELAIGTSSFSGSHIDLTDVEGDQHHTEFHNGTKHQSYETDSDVNTVGATSAAGTPGTKVATVGHIHGIGDFAIPVGTIVAYGGSTLPANFWLLCDGSSYLRSAYQGLFDVIGTAYGSVDGTHFNVPDLRQRFPMGKAASGTGATLGGTGGTVDHAHQTHSSDGSHTHDGHGTVIGAHTEATNTTTGGGGTRETSGTHAGSHSNTGTAHTHDAHNAQNAPFQTVNYIIRTS